MNVFDFSVKLSKLFIVIPTDKLRITDLADCCYLNNIGNIGIYFTKYRNFIGMFYKNIYVGKILKLCIQYKYLHC